MLRVNVFLVIFLSRTALSDLVQSNYTYEGCTNNLEKVLNDGNKTYVGGIDYMIAIDTTNGNVTKVDIPPASTQYRTCIDFKRNPEECVNAIRVIEKVNSTTLLVCGTNVADPKCYYIDVQTYEKTLAALNANNWLGSDQTKRTASLVLNYDSNPELYVGSCKGTRDCVISRRLNNSLQTFSGNQKWFSDPSYLNGYASHPSRDKIYFFYRDDSLAFQDDDFTAGGQRNTYAMVSRICAADMGGGYTLSQNFVTFMRARLLCPLPGGSATGSQNTYYNYMRATYQVGNTVYAVFSYPSSWNPSSSAVCTYDLSTIDTYMDGTVFPGSVTRYFDESTATERSFTDPSSAFLPGQCPGSGQSTRSVNGAYETFIRETSTLVKKIVPPLMNKPTHFAEHNLFNFITVEPIGAYHIVYLLTENGFMRKVRLSPGSSSEPVTLSEVQVNSGTILSVTRNNKDLMLVTATNVLRVSGADCRWYTTCGECESDPNCEWQAGTSMQCVTSQTSDVTVRECSASPAPPSGITISQSMAPFEISWTNGSSGAPPTGYIYKIVRRNTGQIMYHETTTSTALLVTASRLPDGGKYTLTVWAVNNETPSTGLVRDFSTGLRTPNLLQPNADANGALVTWDSVASAVFYNVTLYKELSNSLVRSYKIMWTPGLSTTPSITIQGLQRDQRYLVVLFAISEDGVTSDARQMAFVTSYVATVASSQVPAGDTSTTVSGIEGRIFTQTSPNNQNTRSITNTLPNSSNAPATTTSAITMTYSSTSSVQAQKDPEHPEPSLNVNIREPVASVGPYVAFIAILGVIVIFLVGIFIHNRCTIGARTKQIRTGDKGDTTLKRKFFLLWFHQQDTTGTMSSLNCTHEEELDSCSKPPLQRSVNPCDISDGEVKDPGDKFEIINIEKDTL